MAADVVDPPPDPPRTMRPRRALHRRVGAPMGMVAARLRRHRPARPPDRRPALEAPVPPHVARRRGLAVPGAVLDLGPDPSGLRGGRGPLRRVLRGGRRPLPAGPGPLAGAAGPVPAGRGRPLDVPVRRRATRDPRHEPGRRPARADGPVARLLPRGRAGGGRRSCAVGRLGAGLEGRRRHRHPAGGALRPGPGRPQGPRRRAAAHRHRAGRGAAAHPGRRHRQPRGLRAPPRGQQARHPAGRSGAVARERGRRRGAPHRRTRRTASCRRWPRS